MVRTDTTQVHGPVHSAEWRRSLRRVQGAFGLALALLIAIGVVSYRSVVQLTAERASLEHTHEVIRQLNTLIVTVAQAGFAERDFVVSGAETYLKLYTSAGRLNQETLQSLQQLTADDPVQQQRLATLAGLLAKRFAAFDAVIETRRSRGLEAALREMSSSASLPLLSEMSPLISEVTSTEESLLKAREQNILRDVTTTKIVIITGSVLAFVLVGLALVAIRRDFTGRERAEAQLDRFFSLSLDFLCIASGDGYFKRVSPAVSDMLGWSVREFLARPYMSLIHPDDHEASLREIGKQMVFGEKVLHFENRFRHKDGSWRMLSWRSMPQPDGLMYATARDVTEQRAQEHELREAKDQLEQRVQERTAELRQTAEDLVKNVAARNDVQQKLQAQLQRLGLLHQITRAIAERQDIKSIFEIVVNTLEEHLPVEGAGVLSYDLPEDRLTLSSIGSNSASLIAKLGMQPGARLDAAEIGLSTTVRGELLYVPDVSALTSTFSQGLVAAGLRSLIAVPLNGESKALGILWVARAPSHAFTTGECEFLQQLSEHVALAAHQARLYGALQTAYNDLRQTQQAVMQHERLRVLGQMASGIAHDINNSMSPVSIYTHLLLEKEPNLSERARSFLKTIQQAVNDVASTVERMREFYRQRDSTALAPLSIDMLVSQVIELTSARWADMSLQSGIVIDLRTEMTSGLPTIMGVESEIREALTNLIFNAVDAMPQGGRLTLRTSVTGDEHAAQNEKLARPYVHVEVIDTGVGMDEETRRRCLELFFTTKGERGTGLGLAMVYGTMERHGGSVEINSALGQGTTVRLSFAVANMAGKVYATASVGASRRLRILVVDDDPVLLQSLYEMLHRDGHTVTAASGGQLGIEMFRSARDKAARFDIVITDLGMPYVDGSQVASAIKAADADTPVIMLTGWGQRLQIEGGAPRSVDRVLGKPPRVQELRAALAELTAQADADPNVQADAAIKSAAVTED